MRGTYHFKQRQWQHEHSNQEIAVAKQVARQAVHGSSAPATTPVYHLKAGGLQMAVWENESVNPDGSPGLYYTITFERRYKDKNGEWQTTHSLRTQDLPKLRLLIDQAYEFILLGGDINE